MSKFEIVEDKTDSAFPWHVFEGGRRVGRLPTKEQAERVKEVMERPDEKREFK